MMAVATKDEIFTTVRDILVEVLTVEEEEVKPDSKLFPDLGAESIDMLDVQFQLEKKFNIKVPKEDLWPQKLIENAAYVQEGRFTSDGIKALHGAMPFVDLSHFEADPRVAELANQLTVNSIVEYVSSKVAA